jgi:hypothetical protein
VTFLMASRNSCTAVPVWGSEGSFLRLGQVPEHLVKLPHDFEDSEHCGPAVRLVQAKISGSGKAKGGAAQREAVAAVGVQSVPAGNGSRTTNGCGAQVISQE